MANSLTLQTFALFLTAFSPASATFTPRLASELSPVPADEAWAKTGVGVPLIFATLNAKNCLQDDAHFWGCIDFTDALFRTLSPTRRLRLGRDQKTFLAAPNTTEKPQSLDPATLVKSFRQERLNYRAQFLALSPAARAQVPFSDYAREIGRSFLLQTSVVRMSASVASCYRFYLEALYGAWARLVASEAFKKQIETSTREEAGLGLNLIYVGKGYLIKDVRPESPADKAGLRRYDILLKVDGRPVDSWSPFDLNERFFGRKGAVELQCARHGKLLAPIKVQQELQVQPFLETELKGNILYLRFREFAYRESCKEISDELARENVEGVILDLRHNYGGLVDVADCLLDLLLPFEAVHYYKQEWPFSGSEAPLAEAQSSVDDQTLKKYGLNRLRSGVKVTVLIDDSSASAAELFASALQDHHTAWIVGRRSYGKATMQYASRFDVLTGEVLPLQTPKGPVTEFHTRERYLRPSQTWLEGRGVEPDFEASENPSEPANFSYHEGDTNISAFPAEGPAWKQDRAAQVAQIESCLDRTRLEAEWDRKAKAFDYPRRLAEEVLRCDGAPPKRP